MKTWILVFLAAFIMLAPPSPAHASCSSVCETGPRCSLVCLPGEQSIVLIGGICVVANCRWCCGAMRSSSPSNGLKDLRAQEDAARTLYNLANILPWRPDGEQARN
jgi:hypothetical protein